MTSEFEEKISKQVGVSLQALEWFILQGFIKSIVEDPEKVKLLFKSAEDSVAIEAILTKIQKQFAPQLAVEVQAPSIEEVLDIKPKELIVKKKTLIY